MNNKTLPILYGIIALLLIGCKNDSNDIYMQYKNQSDLKVIKQRTEDNTLVKETNDEDDILKGTLTITLYYDTIINDLADKFMNEHPEVTIKINQEFNPATFTTSDGAYYAKRMATALMSGSAPDIIGVDLLDYNKYAKSGLLVNLYDYMKNENYYKEEDYYTNIFNLLEFEDGLYALPMNFYYRLYRFNFNVIEKLGINSNNYKGIKASTIIDLYNEAKENKELPDNIMPWEGPVTKEDFDVFEYSRFVNLNDKIANFNSPGFIQYLKWSNLIPANQNARDIITLAPLDYSRLGLDYLMTFEIIHSRNFGKLGDISSHVSKAIPYITEDSQHPVFIDRIFSIPETSANKNLAWEFLYYCIMEKDKLDDSQGYLSAGKLTGNTIPININNFKKLFIASTNEKKEAQEELHQIDEWNKQRNVVGLSNQDFMSIFWDDKDLFYNYDNRITAEDLADIMQKKADIYFGE